MNDETPIHSHGIEDRLERIEAKIDGVRRTLSGSDSDPSKGVIVRLDRVEQAHQRTGRIAMLAIGASLTAVFGVLAKVLSRS